MKTTTLITCFSLVRHHKTSEPISRICKASVFTCINNVTGFLLGANEGKLSISLFVYFELAYTGNLESELPRMVLRVFKHSVAAISSLRVYMLALKLTFTLNST